MRRASAMAILLWPTLALAQEGTGLQPLSLILLMGGLALLPFALIMVTSFVKIAVVLSLLRSALGTPQIPPTMVITGLSLVLTATVMSPVAFQAARAVEPALEAPKLESWAGLMDVGQRAVEPVREFLIRHADAQERSAFHRMALELRQPQDREGLTDRDLAVIVPAFVVSELKDAFRIGFLVFLPFLVIDLVVANILLALGMHMLSPTTVSLPFKLLLFVMADGWHLVTQGLVMGYLS